LASGKTEDVKAKFMIGADGMRVLEFCLVEIRDPELSCLGAHSWVRKTLDIAMEGEQSKYAWGVIDILPDSDFPDIRNKTVVHSNSGSCMIIPREGDKIRVYIQLEDELIAKAITSDTRRVDKTKLTPEQLLDVAKKIFHPYRLEARDGFEWWTIYISKSCAITAPAL
jgi:phenol 2-monooxygenase (NADPH)